MGYDSKGILVFNLKYEHAISFINLVKFIYQMPRSISSKLFVIASGEANVHGSSYYWNVRTSSFKQVACLILHFIHISFKSSGSTYIQLFWMLKYWWILSTFHVRAQDQNIFNCFDLFYVVTLRKSSENKLYI